MRTWSADRRPVTGVRLFASTIDEPRARRATDLLLLVGSLLALVAISVAAEPTPRAVGALDDLIGLLPDVLDPLWQILADLLALAALALLIAVGVRRRWAVLRDMLLALAVATLVWQLVGRATGTGWPAVWDSLRAVTPPGWYPSPRVALAGAVIGTATPHLTVPVRRLARQILGVGAFALVALGATSSLGAVAALLVATVAAAAVHLAVGSSGGRPGLDHVRGALAELGVTVGSLGAASRQEAGLFQVDAVDDEGRDLLVRVYGRDAYDAALVSTAWRRVWFRDPGGPARIGRLEQVEHEAFTTLFAHQAGVSTDVVVTAGSTSADDALLVLHRRGRLLRDEPAVEPGTLRQLWALVGRLHDAGMAHGRIDASAVLVTDDGDLGVVDLRGAVVAPSEAQVWTDEVQCLVTTMLLSDVATAVEVAVDAVPAERLEAILPLVQVSILTSGQRLAVREGEIDLGELRAALAERLGIEAPQLLQLRRITVGTVVRVVLPAVAVVALISQFAGLDIQEMADVLAEASWGIALVAFALAQLARLTQALSTLGAAPVPLPLGPVYALQLSLAYISLAIPSSAARIGINIRFLQRHGVPPGAALAAGGIDGFGGFVVQSLLLVLLLGFSSVSLDLDLGSAVDDATAVLVIALVIAAGGVATVVAVGRLRRFVVEWALRLGREALDAVRGLRSPRRLLLLFGGNLATELIFAAALGGFVRAIGYEVGFGELLLINIGVSLFAGLMPVPGGIGVSEGALTFGLVQAGIPEEEAFAAVLLYRLATFYLPPIWGAFAFRWLERNDHL